MNTLPLARCKNERPKKHCTRSAYATITRWKRGTITKGPAGRLSTPFGTQAVRRDHDGQEQRFEGPALPSRLRGRRKRSNVPPRGGGRYGANRVDPGVGGSWQGPRLQALELEGLRAGSQRSRSGQLTSRCRLPGPHFAEHLDHSDVCQDRHGSMLHVDFSGGLRCCVCR